MPHLRASLLALIILGAPFSPNLGAQSPQGSLILELTAVEKAMIAKYGETERARIHRGLHQVQRLWRKEDGDAGAMKAFALAHFCPQGPALDALYQRLSFVLESLDGHLLELSRDLKQQSQLDLGAVYPFDELMENYDPGAHVLDDWYTSKLAFVVLLNFRQSNLQERNEEGASWTRRQWAEARLVDRFSKRIPAEVAQSMAQASGEAERYIASYNIWMHHLVNEKGQRLFPAGKKLLSHWNLRDELKSQYAQGAEGLQRQRMILKVMERIVTQEIPAAVVDNPLVDWNPFTNEIRPSTVKDSDRTLLDTQTKLDSKPEGVRRYEVWHNTFQAVRKADPYSPQAPTHIARKFEEDRQLPETRVKKMLEDVLSSSLVPRVARIIEKRLGRKLGPQDLWYAGFGVKGDLPESQLDEITRKRFPTPAAYKTEIPSMLKALGFTQEKAQWLASKIEVDPARGSGHAMGAERRADNAHLRTRIGQGGMDYKGFNIAVHEMGHNVEQVFSLNGMDEFLLKGVPNTAFTEAMAYTFQDRDLQILGLSQPKMDQADLKVLSEFWMTYEIAGVSLVDMEAWRWMYEHPEATPQQFKEAFLGIAKSVWNRYYADVLGQKDSPLLGIYSHFIHSFLYLPDYAIGHLISLQIQQKIEKSGQLALEVERMCRQGRLTPDLWMMQATGRKVGAEALLEATSEVLGRMK